MMSIAGVIGAALFVGSGSIIAAAGPAVILAYCAGGALVVFIMRMLGEMAATSPDTGSFSTYAERAIGRWAGFTIGWLYWWFWVLLMAWEAYVAGLILHEWFPLLSVNVFTLMMTITLTAINFMRVSKYGEVEFWFALIKVIAIVLFIVLGILAISRLWPVGGVSGLSNLSTHGGFMPNGLGPVIVALLGVMFSFLGAEIVTIAASESKNPVEQTKRAIKSVVWRICLFYIGSIFLIVCIVPWNDPLLSQTGYGAYRRTFEILGIPATKWIMNFVVLTSVSSCFVSGHYTASRMLYSLSKRGDAPTLFQKTRKNGTPVFAVLASCVVAFAIALMNFFDALKPREILDILMNTTGMIAMLVYLVIAISQLRLRRKMEREGQEIKLKMWFFPWLSYLVIAFIVASLIAMTFIEQYRVLVISTGGAALIVIFIGITLQFKAYRRKLAAQRPLKRSYF
ncbi:amino acid permease family protein [Acinetobacter sp. 263903-1]|nr:amino acid permease family protein [Acinetobacter sp. 1461402]EXB69656.1 amino acid permease family protein [Acinetobacter sp. 230853]EXC32874.1 amino acid permease family protein [Acinetobacter sp. 869535]EXE12747.1 amino acid permease family protein [Acinetobacter sp. 983759]KCX35968.1 amino acid permease family protein [Acinetobacter sp. 263903-1]WGX74151.1 amino acid permease [Acinetobacter radioresistens]BBL21031.1 GABA permease [Acinetobacter radioresistens DSM 6976 = NBRC 102413 = C